MSLFISLNYHKINVQDSIKQSDDTPQNGQTKTIQVKNMWKKQDNKAKRNHRRHF